MNKNKYWETYFERYPLSQIQDFIKFLYQSVLGSFHLIENKQANYERLLEEVQSIQHDRKHILYEEISDELVRVHLEALNDSALPEIHRLFMKSSEITSSKEKLLDELKKAEKGIQEGWIPFTQEEWRKYVQDYIQQGCPAISHTHQFREYYHPHYRLMKKEYLEELSRLQAI